MGWQFSKMTWQKIVVAVIVIAMFFLGAWTSGGTPDEERVKIELTALKDGYADQLKIAYAHFIDDSAAKGRGYAIPRLRNNLH